MKKIGILISGRGSNMEAIIKAINDGRITNAQIVVVISNKDSAGGIEIAKKNGIDTHVLNYKSKSREEFDREISAILKSYNVDLICLAGYMRLLSPWFTHEFENRILNIHPSLLPSFPGLNAQKQAFDYGVKFTGCTVHFVDELLDHGPIIKQAVVPVLPDDTVETLSARILEEEHRIYPEAIELILKTTF